MPKLWEIADDLVEIAAEIVEAGGELTPELEARLDAQGALLEAKVEALALLIRERELDAEAAKAEEYRLAMIRKSHERTAASLKDYVLRCMESAGVQRVETPLARVRVQRSGTPRVEYAGDVMALPAWARRHIPEAWDVDRKALTEAVREGDELPAGVVVTYSHHLRIA